MSVVAVFQDYLALDAVTLSIKRDDLTWRPLGLTAGTDYIRAHLEDMTLRELQLVCLYAIICMACHFFSLFVHRSSLSDRLKNHHECRKNESNLTLFYSQSDPGHSYIYSPWNWILSRTLCQYDWEICVVRQRCFSDWRWFESGPFHEKPSLRILNDYWLVKISCIYALTDWLRCQSLYRINMSNQINSCSYS